MSENILQDAYNQYREHGFILQKAAKHKKHAHRKGAYADRKNEPYEDSATGYVAIIPPNLVIVDNDKYEDDGASFKQLLKDLGIDANDIIPFALTPSGGEHYAFENPDPDLVVGNLGKTYQALDIYAGYQSVLPIVGTTVINKQGELASYEWGDDLSDSFIVNPTPDKMVDVLKMRKRAEGAGADYEEDNDLSLAIKADEMSDDEVDNLLASIPADVHYDDWLAVAMCLYDRYEGGEEGLKKLQEFGERSPEKNDANRTESKWYSGHFKPTQTTFKRLRSMAHENELSDLKDEISKAEPKTIDKIIKRISDTPHLNTRGKLDGDVRMELAEDINTRLKTLKKEGKVKGSVTQARTIVKQLEHEVTMEEVEKSGEGYDVEVFISGTKYVLRVGQTLMEDLTESFLKKHLTICGIPPKFVDAYVRDAKLISDVEMTTDYLLDKPIDYKIEKSQAIEKLPVLTIAKDPFHDIHDYIDDEEILDDFYNKVWNGKAKDIIELIALTIRYREWKLNRLMIVAPSDTGKTTLTEHLGFQKIHMQRLLAAMRGDKGIGTNVVSGVKNSGLLLIDEANKALEQDIKDMDRELYVDEFGAGGGTQKIRLHFTALTSTHKKATRNSSDELYNRFLQVELTENEMEHTITKSAVYRKDTERYSEVVQKFSQYHFKQCLKGEQYTKEYLHELQSKYRLPLDTDLDEFLYGVSESVIEHIEQVATSSGDILEKQGAYFIKRKVDLFNMVEEMIKELPNIDSGKYADKIVSHFLQQKPKSIKVDGKPIKYYPIEMKHYIFDEEQQIIEMFDDLDAEA